jgi:NAD(P)-dependent dehydrogenase (short-subunit alcohol dehydrogenase family)
VDLDLDGKLALVTGSTKGIGRAIAAELAAEGAEVIVHGRRADEVDAVVAELSVRHKVHGVVGDLATADGTAAVISAVGAFGPVEILVNNAATFRAAPFGELSDADWDHVFQVNLMAAVRLSREFFPSMLAAGWGRIVYISSDYAVQPNQYLLHYSVSKTAGMSFVRGLAELTKGTGVTVNTVIAGPTWTEGAAGFLENSVGDRDVDEVKREFFAPGGFLSGSLLDRYAEPREVAGLVAFVCSPRASAINGAAQRVEGGFVKSIM